MKGTTVMNNAVKYRSPWVAYLLSMVTIGIYYIVWHVKVNQEIAQMHGGMRVGNVGLALSQFVWPCNWISLANTSNRLTTLQAKHGITPTTTAGMMILSNWWFGSNVRYMQRRLNATYRELGIAETSTAAITEPPAA
jgi:hypothetical protein